MAKTKAQNNRAIRQEALREQLANKGLIQHVLEIVSKLQDPCSQIESEMVARYKIAIDTQLKLVNKYLPDLKSTEITGEGGGDLEVLISQIAPTTGLPAPSDDE